MKKPIITWFNGYTSLQPTRRCEISFTEIAIDHKDQVVECREGRLKKSQLPCLTVCGDFDTRNLKGLKQHSGLICIDIDGKANQSITDWGKARDSMAELPYVLFAAVSVSGNGMFAIIRLATPEKHLEHFRALVAEFLKLGFTLDEACKDIARLRTVTYDPDYYLNLDALVFDGLLAIGVAGKKPIKLPDVNTLEGDEAGVCRLVKIIESEHINMCEDYKQWFAIGGSLACAFGERGRDFFHIISQQSGKYNREECDKQYEHCIEGCNSFTLATFIFYCKTYGISLNKKRQVVRRHDNRERFDFRIEWESVFSKLSGEDAKSLIRILCDYANGKTPDFKDNMILEVVFEQFRLHMDKDRSNYLSMCARNSENGVRGGAPKGNTNARKNNNTNRALGSKNNEVW